ncbi:MAG: Holliday junction resolvase RuvX [Acidobacteriota bacterium]
MRTAGVDYGARRIGLAVSDESGTLARPASTIRGHADPVAAARLVADQLQRLTRDLGEFGTIVVGLPRRLDGSPNDQTPAAEAFASALSAFVACRVVLQDERLTSHEADQLLAESARDWRVRKAKLDAAAAAVILQEYLDRQGHEGHTGPASESSVAGRLR